MSVRPVGTGRQERGATSILLAMLLFLLLGVAAVAVDLARGWNERRQDQTSVDIAAVAGALSFGTNQTNIASQVMSAARLNLDTAYSDSEWDDLWTACAGPPPSGFVPVNHATLGTIDCIGLNASYLWVRLPEQIIDTSFGKAVGVDTLQSDAEVIVTLFNDSGKGALPFAVRGNATSGEVCVDTATGNKIEPPCDGNESGSFGNIAPPLFGNAGLGTSPSCDKQSSANNYVPESLAMGIDHVIWAMTESAWNATGWSASDNTSNSVVEDNTNVDECIDNGGPLATAKDGVPINAVLIDTGNNTKSDLTEGLMSGVNFSDGQDARLTRSTNTRSVDGYQLDNNALWKYLMRSSDHGIALCDGDTIRGLSTIEEKNDAMRACLEFYATTYPAPAVGPQIITDAILESPRVGVAPRLWHDNLGSGISYRPVKQFDVVYIHGLWFNDDTFFPDDGNTPIALKKTEIQQVTAYLLMDSMVSANVHDQLGGFANDTWQPEIYE